MKKKVTYDPERRTHIAHARMNDDEWTLFMSQLDQLGLSQSEFIRQAIFTAKVNVTVQPVFQSDTLDEIAAQYGKIGSNLNQIAHYLNGGQSYAGTSAAGHQSLSRGFAIAQAAD